MSYSNRYTPYSSARSRARGNQRAADQQRDSTQVTLNKSINVSCGQTFTYIQSPEYEEDIIDPEEFVGWKDTGCAAINIYDVLRRSEFYDSYSSMYDQVRIDSITAKITALSWVNGVNSGVDNAVSEYLTPRSLTVVTAWDRSGLDGSQMYSTLKDGNPIFYCTVSKDITTYSSAKTKHLGPGTSYEITRYLYPSTIVEKSQFVSTTDLRQQYVRDNSEFFEYREFKWINGVNGERIPSKFTVNSKYPTNLLRNPGVSFKPTLLLNVIAGPDPTTVTLDGEEVGVNKLKPTTFNIEFDIVVTFRGLRYSKVIE